MHAQTHILSGWCIGNLLPLNARQRLFCMLAASLPDLDGLGVIVSQDAYWAMHHKVGHGIAFGVLLSGALAAISPRKMLSFLLYLAVFHLHLGMDVLGSGANWDIYYLWPFSNCRIKTDWGWPLFSWQNITAFFILFAWTIIIAIRQRRTPLELLMPSLDRRLLPQLSLGQR